MPYGINKFAKRVGRQAKKRYVRKGRPTGVRNLNYSQIAKDVKYLKGLVNAEKQNADFSIASPGRRFALSNGAGATGAQIFSIHPTVGQGVSEDQRKGDTYKICSMLLQARITYDQTYQDINWKMYIVRKPNQEFTASAAELNNFLEPNPFTGLVDYNSLRNYEQFKDYVVIKQMSGRLKASNAEYLNSQVSKQIQIPLKLDFHTRYDKGTTNILANEVFCILVADDKAINAFDSPEFSCHNRIWFYDN